MSSTSPIFLAGVGRSGTTLLRLMLDSHSRVAIPDESNVFVLFHEKLDRFGDLGREESRRALLHALLATPRLRRWDWPVPAEAVDLDRCDSLAGTIDQILSAYARHFGKDVWGDKSPPYTGDLHVLNELFPDARFIHLVRDGRDVAQSLVKQWWGPNDFAGAIRHWAETVECAHKMLRMLPPQRWRELRFEDLVADPARELRALTDFLGLEYQEGMLAAYAERAPAKVWSEVPETHAHLRQAPSAAQAFKWRRSLGRLDQAIAFEIAGPVLRRFGYEDGATRHPLKLAGQAVHRLRRAYAWKFGRSRAAVERIRERGTARVPAPEAG